MDYLKDVDSLEKIYEDLKLETFYDSNKKGYWLNIKNKKPSNGEPSFLFSERSLEDFVGLNYLGFLEKINDFDDMILYSAKGHKIPIDNIQHALEKTKEIEEEKFQKFKKANNL